MTLAASDRGCSGAHGGAPAAGHRAGACEQSVRGHRARDRAVAAGLESGRSEPSPRAARVRPCRPAARGPRCVGQSRPHRRRTPACRHVDGVRRGPGLGERGRRAHPGAGSPRWPGGFVHRPYRQLGSFAAGDRAARRAIRDRLSNRRQSRDRCADPKIAAHLGRGEREAIRQRSTGRTADADAFAARRVHRPSAGSEDERRHSRQFFRPSGHDRLRASCPGLEAGLPGHVRLCGADRPVPVPCPFRSAAGSASDERPRRRHRGADADGQ